MDGFNVIPISNSPGVQSSGSFAAANSSSGPVDVGIEFVDEEKEKAKAAAAAGISWAFVFSIIALIGVLGYFGFLVFYRVSMITQIQNYTDQMVTLGKNIDVKEMKDFQAMDITLNTINGKLSNHVLTAQIFSFINQNIRSNLEITDYSLEVKDKTVNVSLVAIAPTFKELAEQTEKLFLLRESGYLQSFSVSNLSFESQTRRLHFTIMISFDKSKVSASALNTNTESTSPGSAGTAGTTTPASTNTN